MRTLTTRGRFQSCVVCWGLLTHFTRLNHTCITVLVKCHIQHLAQHIWYEYVCNVHRVYAELVRPVNGGCSCSQTLPNSRSAFSASDANSFVEKTPAYGYLSCSERVAMKANQSASKANLKHTRTNKFTCVFWLQSNHKQHHALVRGNLPGPTCSTSANVFYTEST